MLLTGSSGQLGTLLKSSAPPALELTPLDRSQLDLSRGTDVKAAVSDLRPGLIVNAAAYTNVDDAESEPEKAFATNAEGPGSLARAAHSCGARLIHVSTDFVFDGQAGRPYRPSDPPSALGVYGRSKLAGERRILEELPERSVILRTAWLYSRYGSNFVKTMLDLMAHREQLAVVTDQIGSPTWAAGLAQAIWTVAAIPHLTGIHHWTDAGIASRYGFAVAVCEEGIDSGLLSRKVPIVPIRSKDYQTAAPRPSFSVLDSTQTHEALNCSPEHWRRALRSMLADLRDSPD